MAHQARSGMDSAGERHASWIELFFDLVFVVAVAKLDDGFSDRPTVVHALIMVGLFVPVWWAWVGLAFYATRFGDDALGFRLLLLIEMAASLALAASVPGAFSGSTSEFALAYCAVRLTLVSLYLRSRRDAKPAERALISALAAGFGAGAALWLVSAFVPAPARYGIWVVALLVDVGAPLLRGRALAAVPIDPSHLPERFGLFVIIVLGEAVATTGGRLADVSLTAGTLVRVIACFVIACVIWWLYFDRAETRIRSEVQTREASGTLARDIYSYGHFPVIVGITFAAAGTRLVVDDRSPAIRAGALSLCLGVAAVLFALALIDAALHRRQMTGAAWVRLGAGSGLIVLAALSGAIPIGVVLWIAAALCLTAVAGNALFKAPTAATASKTSARRRRL